MMKPDTELSKPRAVKAGFSRRQCLNALAGLSIAGTSLAGGGLMRAETASAQQVGRRLPQSDWQLFARQFIRDGGRVVDTGNNGISHSEGQGYGMLLAEAAGDQEIFDDLWRWTRQNLQVRDDRLFAWTWSPTAPGNGITDFNNASDGELLIAWALHRAAEHFDNKAYRFAAEMILEQLVEKAVVDLEPWGRILRPGVEGFGFDEGRRTVNPSYWLFPAFDYLAREHGDPVWNALTESGLKVLDAARFGDHGLTADWVDLVDGEARLAEGFDPVYGYNAIRVPMHLAWREVGDSRPYLEPYLALPAVFGGYGQIPATINVADGTVDPRRLSRGGQAGLILAERCTGGEQLPMPTLGVGDDYFSSALLLLSKIALLEVC
jgi:endoglucanase